MWKAATQPDVAGEYKKGVDRRYNYAAIDKAERGKGAIKIDRR